MSHCVALLTSTRYRFLDILDLCSTTMQIVTCNRQREPRDLAARYRDFALVPQ
jgi:hypothetical protein